MNFLIKNRENIMLNKNHNPLSKKQKIILISVGLCFIFLLGGNFQYYLSRNFIVNNTPSLPYRFFKIEGLASDFKIKTGDFVTACPLPDKELDYIERLKEYNSLNKDGRCYNGMNPVVKIVGAVAGMKIEISDNGISIDDHAPLHGTAMRDAKLKHFNYKGTVPENHYLLYTHYERGYDSRYFGLINKNELIYKVTPLF